MEDVLWQRDRARVNDLLAEAKLHRLKRLPLHLDKCPLAALETYLENNWRYFRFAAFKDASLPTVSARAEAQVRDRTKDRYAVAGAWKLENLEPKATLRAIIAEGSWPSFRAHVLDTRRTDFERGLNQRLKQAAAEGRLTAEQVSKILPEQSTLFQPTAQMDQAA